MRTVTVQTLSISAEATGAAEGVWKRTTHLNHPRSSPLGKQWQDDNVLAISQTQSNPKSSSTKKTVKTVSNHGESTNRLGLPLASCKSRSGANQCQVSASHDGPSRDIVYGRAVRANERAPVLGEAHVQLARARARATSSTSPLQSTTSGDGGVAETSFAKSLSSNRDSVRPNNLRASSALMAAPSQARFRTLTTTTLAEDLRASASNTLSNRSQRRALQSGTDLSQQPVSCEHGQSVQGNTNTGRPSPCNLLILPTLIRSRGSMAKAWVCLAGMREQRHQPW